LTSCLWRPTLSNLPYGSEWKGIPIDVEQLPVQLIRISRKAKATAVKVGPAAVAAGTRPQRQRFGKIVGGISISPLNAPFVGTLGCFLRRRRIDSDEIFVLSNNHVLADLDSLPIGTDIVQPGPEVPPFTTSAGDVFASLNTVIPIHFPAGESDPVRNRFDAALANVTDSPRIEPGKMFGGISL
jgi:hypothetical protein